MTHSVMDTRAPAKMYGIALGNANFRRVCNREDPSERARSAMWAGIDLRPVTVLTRMGKKAMIDAVTTWGTMPNPRSSTSSGAIAMDGMTCDATMSGMT